MAPLLGSIVATGVQAQGQTSWGSRALVACFSRTGNTRVIANYVRRARSADYFEIVPASSYPEDYEETVAQAQRERDAAYRPELRELVSGMSGYEAVYLAFPIWGTTAPPPVRSFLATHDLTGKTIHPLITHGGYGLGSSLAVLAEGAPGATIADAFTLEADQERRTIDAVSTWLITREQR